MSIHFTVPGNPIPWQRAGKSGSRHFTKPATRVWQEMVRAYARQAGVKPLAGEVGLKLHFFRKSAQACDIDNLEKSVLDALIRIAFADDRQVVAVAKGKFIDRVRPRLEIEIFPIGGA